MTSQRRELDNLTPAALDLPTVPPNSDAPARVTYPAGCRLDANHHFRRAVAFEIEQAADHWLIVEPLTDRFGDGESFADAWAALAESLTHYWRTLRDDRERLSPRLAGHLQALEQMLIEAPAS